MLMELLKDNSYLVDSVTEEQFDKFVGLMLKNKVNQLKLLTSHKQQQQLMFYLNF